MSPGAGLDVAEKRYLSVPAIEPQTLALPARILVVIPTELSQPSHAIVNTVLFILGQCLFPCAVRKCHTADVLHILSFYVNAFPETGLHS
jgi:hypothetical protein